MSDTTNIGLIHNKDLPKDAVHIAIVQVRAGEKLKAADRVGFKNTLETGVTGVVYKEGEHIGIIDPFIEGEVNKDCLCYLFIFPNTVTSLTHNWEHPLFNRTPERIAAARKWLDENGEDRYDDHCADGSASDYVYGDRNSERFIEEFNEGKVGYYAHGEDFSAEYNSNDGFKKKFWDNLEIVTGKLATKEQRAQEYFSCSC